MRTAGRVNVVVTRIPAVSRGVDPSIQLKSNFVRAPVIHLKFTRMRQRFWPAVVGNGVVAGGQQYLFAIEAVDLRLKEKIGRQPFRGSGVEAVQAIANREAGHRGL